MTQPDTTTTNPDEVSTPEVATDTATNDTEGQPTAEQESPNSEAAKYRVKLREAETERDTLAGRLTAMQRRECEAAVADLLQVPADLWDLGSADPADFYDSDDLNQDALRAAASALVSQRPGLAKTKTFDGPRNWGQASAPAPTPTSWNQVIKSG